MADSKQIPADFVSAFQEFLQTQYETTQAADPLAQRDVLTRLIQQVQTQNAYVQPNGQLAFMDASQVDITAAVAQARGGSRRQDEQAEGEVSQRNLYLLGVVALFVMLYLGYFLWSRRPSAQQVEPAAAGAEAALVEAEPTPTLEPLPPVSQDALAAIDGNGERLTLGEPSLLEIVYQDGQGVTALPISPAGLTDVGALRYQESVMLGDSPVAIWLANTRLNYGIGVPRSVVQRIAAGDRISVFTNTGVEIPFIAREKTSRQSYQTADILKQDEIGLALFALPALSDSEVDVVFAVYDVSHEARLGSVAAAGERLPLGDLWVMVDEETITHERADGQLALTVRGTIEGELQRGEQLLVNVTTAQGAQTGTTALIGGNWEQTFLLPAEAQGKAAVLELRRLPESALVTVQLPILPTLQDNMTSNIAEAWLIPETGEMMLTVTLSNENDAGTIWLNEVDIDLKHPDGQPLESNYSSLMPLQIEAGQAVTQTLTVIPIQQDAPVQLQVGAEMWEVVMP